MWGFVVSCCYFCYAGPLTCFDGLLFVHRIFAFMFDILPPAREITLIVIACCNMLLYQAKVQWIDKQCRDKARALGPCLALPQPHYTSKAHGKFPRTDPWVIVAVRSVGRSGRSGRSVGRRDGRSVGRSGRSVGGRSGRVRNLNTLLGDLNLRWGLGLVPRALD